MNTEAPKKRAGVKYLHDLLHLRHVNSLTGEWLTGIPFGTHFAPVQ
jgi:hypothetical protein